MLASSPIHPAAGSPSLPDDVPLLDKVLALHESSTYPGHPLTIVPIETHMAWVFLTDRLAFKMKKPVRYEFLDFSTLDRRLQVCRDEVRLNRRLAPGTYLGVVPLVRTEGGQLRLEQPGLVIEWMVKMKRLPSERMLDRALAAGVVEPVDLQRVAHLLAGFYRTAVRPPLTAAGYGERLRREVERNHTALCDPAFHLPTAAVERVATEQIRIIRDRAEWWQSRVEGGWIVEGHGDLRPEHIYLGPPVSIIDCIEFNADFRILDAADELAFLALEAGRLGAPHVRKILFDAYRPACEDYLPDALVEFYLSFRAYLRAKIAAWHISEPGTHHPEAWRRRALDYLYRARRHVANAALPCTS